MYIKWRDTGRSCQAPAHRTLPLLQSPMTSPQLSFPIYHRGPPFNSREKLRLSFFSSPNLNFEKIYSHFHEGSLQRRRTRESASGNLDLLCRSRSTRWRTSFDIRRSPTDSALLCWRSAEVHPAGTRRHQTPRMATDLELAHTAGGNVNTPLPIHTGPRSFPCLWSRILDYV